MARTADGSGALGRSLARRRPFVRHRVPQPVDFLHRVSTSLGSVPIPSGAIGRGDGERGQTGFPEEVGRDRRGVRPRTSVEAGPWSTCAEGPPGRVAPVPRPVSGRDALAGRASIAGLGSPHAPGFVGGVRRDYQGMDSDIVGKTVRWLGERGTVPYRAFHAWFGSGKQALRWADIAA